MARAPRFASRLSLSGTLLHGLLGAVLLVHAGAEARGAIHAAHHVVVGHAREQVVTAAGQVLIGCPLPALEVDICFLVALAESLQQLAETETVGVYGGQGNEQEPVTELAKLLVTQRVRVEMPLEGARPVEGEAGLGEALAHFGGEGLDRRALGGGELTPDQIGQARVEIAQSALDG